MLSLVFGTIKHIFTWTINRESNTSLNELSVWNVREKLTGGTPTNSEEPLIIEWFPTKINIFKGGEVYKNVLQYLIRKHNPLNCDYKEIEEVKQILIEPEDAFDITDEDIPF